MGDEGAAARRELRRLIDGFKTSQAIYVLVHSGVADLLAEGDVESSVLAARAGLHPPSLYRLLRALASAGVLEELEDRRFRLTEMGRALAARDPASLAGWADYMGGEVNWRTWGNLDQSVRTGQSGNHLLFGIDGFQYRAAHPEEQARYDRAMVSAARQGTEAVLAAYNFSRFRQVVDVGGGHGAFLGAILARHPQLSGVLFDQPHVVAGAAPVLRAAGVLDRCTVVGGSFFESVPSGGDLYIVKAVLHDWDDESARRLLARCREAIGPGGVLLVVERVLAPPNEGLDDKLSDLNMLVNTGGLERTAAEFAALLSGAGFELRRVIETRGPQKVLESVPA